MPNRILRAELLESEAWLGLKDNADRSAWIACFLSVDTLGDMPAGPLRLTRLWTPYGIDTSERASKVFTELCDVDLVRRYEVERKVYLHIPRFKQRLRYLGTIWPLSPWATDEEKQRVAKKSQVILRSTHEDHCEPPHDVDVDVDVDVIQNQVYAPEAKTSISKKTKHQTPWDRDEDTTRVKAAELGVDAIAGESWDDWRTRIRRAIASRVRNG